MRTWVPLGFPELGQLLVWVDVRRAIPASTRPVAMPGEEKQVRITYFSNLGALQATILS